MTNLTVSNTWIDTAEDRAETMHNPKLFIGGGMAGGLILGSLLNPLTGLFSLAYGFYLAWDANERNSDQIEAVEEGLIAHLLTQKQLRKYQAEVGEDQVRGELSQALERDLKLSEDADTLASTWGLKGTPGPRLPAWPRLPLGPAQTETAVSSDSPIPPLAVDLQQNRHSALTPSNPDDAGDATAPVEAVSNGDDVTADAALTSPTNSEDGHTVSGSYGIDKLKGVSLKQFRSMLQAQGITHENGCFKSVEAVDLSHSEQYVRARLKAFWDEFHSRKINHAVYFVFGLQSGGGRSEEATARFIRAKEYVEDWFSLWVDGENPPEVF